MGWISADVVPSKGVCGCSAHGAGREIYLAGLRRMAIKSDQEPALKESLRAVKAEGPKEL